MRYGKIARRLVLAVSLAACTGAASAQVPDKFRNLKVLPKNVSREELVHTMRDFATALGVGCGHCHSGGNPSTLEGVDFASDAKWEKRTARDMLRMVRKLNAEYIRPLASRPPAAGVVARPPVPVDCITCHRGLAMPETIDGVLDRVLQAEGVDAAVRTYKELRTNYLGQGSYDFSERAVNRLAERLLDEKRAGDAARLLEASAEFNADAAWLHHLLGEARLAQGDRARALATFERALALEPENTLTRDRVQELKASGSEPR